MRENGGVQTAMQTIALQGRRPKMHQPSEIPTESYLKFHRVITFLDEWLFYSLLLFLYLFGHMTLFYIVLPVGTTFIIVSYIKMWYMEAMRFEV